METDLNLLLEDLKSFSIVEYQEILLELPKRVLKTESAMTLSFNFDISKSSHIRLN